MTVIDNIDSDIYYDIWTFDPDTAAKFLEERGFENNRLIRNGRVGLLAAKMKSGRYKDNGTPSVTIAKDGKLRNGHHTLHAVVRAECSIRLRVAWNVPDDSYDTFDTGAIRSAADILGAAGHTNTNALAALLRPVIRWERGNRGAGLFASDAAPYDPIMPSDYEDALEVVGDEVRAAVLFAHNNKGIVAGNSTGRIKTRARAMFNPTALAFAHYVLVPHHGGEEYLTAITSGANLAPQSAELAVRNFFTVQNPQEIAAIATILRGYRRSIEGLGWTRVDPSKFTDNPTLWEV